MAATEGSRTIYRIGFADGRAYVGVTSKEVAVRVRQHGQLYSAVNMELYKRLSAGLPYELTILAADVPAGKAYARELAFIHAEPAPLNRLSPLDPGVRTLPLTPSSTYSRPYRAGRRRNKPVRPGTYTCSLCRDRLPHTAFYKDRTRFNGLHSRCKDCYKSEAARRRGALPDQGADGRPRAGGVP